MLIYCTAWYDSPGELDLDVSNDPVNDGEYAGRMVEGRYGTYCVIYVGF